MSLKELNSWLRELSDEVEGFSIAELKNFIKDSKSDSNDFIRDQTISLEKYLIDLAKEEITLKQFKSHVQDLVDFAKIHVSKEKVRGKVKIKTFTQELIRLVIGGLIKALL